MSLPRLLSLLVVCCSGIVACVAPYRNYPPGSLTDEQVAILDTKNITHIKDEAGNNLPDDKNYVLFNEKLHLRPLKAQLTPGKYWIRMMDGSRESGRKPIKPAVSGHVELKAGHRYTVKYHSCWWIDWREICRDRRRDYWLQLEDIGTGEVVAPQREVEWQQLHR